MCLCLDCSATWRGRLSWSPPPSIVSSPATRLNKIIREGGGGPSTWDQTKRNSLSVGDQDFHSVIESAGAYRVGGIGREIK